MIVPSRYRRVNPKVREFSTGFLQPIRTIQNRMHGDIGTIQSGGRLDSVENPGGILGCSARAGFCTHVVGLGVSFVTTPICDTIVGPYSVGTGEKMSVRSALLAHEISTAWLRNAFAGFL